MSIDGEGLAAPLVAALVRAQQSVATAESLTGGLVVATLIDIPGASAAVRGGVVAYHSDLKADLVGVDAGLLAAGGSVQAEVALQLARGACERFGADWGIGTTGVAGPESADGCPVGTVFVAIVGPGRDHVRRWHLAGDRRAVRAETVRTALEMLSEQLALAEGETVR